MQRMTPKVFGIGFHKTGTTSLGMALGHLAYEVCLGSRPLREALGHRRLMAHLTHNEFHSIVDVAERFDACVDSPWFILYRELDRRFPGSKFILTVRDETAWLDSAIRYYAESESELRRWIYGVGTPVGHEETYLHRYRMHRETVAEYFRGREDQLLVVDWTRDGWPALATFLGREAPAIPFPHISPKRGARPAAAKRDG
jgi:hypothetical protein